jgi:hypothetical protein
MTTVSELIEFLQTLPPHFTVGSEYCNECAGAVEVSQPHGDFVVGRVELRRSGIVWEPDAGLLHDRPFTKDQAERDERRTHSTLAATRWIAQESLAVLSKNLRFAEMAARVDG